MKTEKTDTGLDFQIEYIESKAGYTHINIRMPSTEFKKINEVMKNKKTLPALYQTAKSTGLDEAMLGSTWCVACYKYGGVIVQHQFKARNWFLAFWHALWYCKGPNFQLKRGKCSSSISKIEYHD